jgi:ADP-ribose pyrophosphatase YjhB (NUDIX family)
MTPAAVTGTLLHDLVTGSHAEGITALGVETVIEHNDTVLLVAEPGPDFDDTWQLPGGPVLPGQTLTDALHPAAAAIGLTIDEVTGYLGHHDHPGAQATTRVFRFAATVTDPGAICRHAGTGHRWVEDLDCPPADAARLPATINMPAATDPPLAGQLRACGRGIYLTRPASSCSSAMPCSCTARTSPAASSPPRPAATAPRWPSSTGPP